MKFFYEKFVTLQKKALLKVIIFHIISLRISARKNCVRLRRWDQSKIGWSRLSPMTQVWPVPFCPFNLERRQNADLILKNTQRIQSIRTRVKIVFMQQMTFAKAKRLREYNKSLIFYRFTAFSSIFRSLINSVIYSSLRNLIFC